MGFINLQLDRLIPEEAAPGFDRSLVQAGDVEPSGRRQCLLNLAGQYQGGPDAETELQRVTDEQHDLNISKQWAQQRIKAVQCCGIGCESCLQMLRRDDPAVAVALLHFLHKASAGVVAFQTPQEG